ncbi:PDZ and LIM domain protein Zasp isoform X10 [Musca domestica]|uniref:PDZ and LIM domain protein Zasp isoform X10 n=1 Tax=Musca domestica TaxID=7370 RepID=A0A9J7IBD2_MUSDO|nr:PDZ and LIM domain protein Zasp isoform X10 [Musca domestica]
MAQPQMMQIKLSRFDAQPWGFRLQGGTDFAQPLLVQKVNGGSLAEQAGLLPGDAVIKINDVDVFNLRHKEAQDIVVRSGNNFVMTVQRGGSTWRPHVQPTGNVPQPNQSHLQTVTKTSLAHKQQDSQHIGCGYNNAAKPFGNTVDGNVKSIVNKQYNTPVGIYSDESIAETLSAQAEVLAGGVLGVNFKKNEKEYQADKSEVLKFLREEESGTSTPEPPSATSYYATKSHAIGGNERRTPLPHDQDERIGTPLHQNTLAPAASHRPSLPTPAPAQKQQQQQQQQHQKVEPPAAAQTVPDQPDPRLIVMPVCPALQTPEYKEEMEKAAAAAAAGDSDQPKPYTASGHPACSMCGVGIVGVFVRIKDKNLHVECFKCATCGTSLKNQGYYNFNNKLYCDIHAKLAAMQNPPPGTDGYVPVPIKPNTKLSASTITSALSAHGFNGVSNGNSTPTPAPVAPQQQQQLPTTTTATPPSSNLPIVDKSLINSDNTKNASNSNIICNNNTNNNPENFNTSAVTNDMSSTMASSRPSISEQSASNGVGGSAGDKPFEYVTLTGNVIRSVVPPGKGTNVNYKVNQGYARPYGAPPAAAPKSPVTFPPQPQQWNAPPPTQPKPTVPAGNPYATLPRSNVGQGQVQQQQLVQKQQQSSSYASNLTQATTSSYTAYENVGTTSTKLEAREIIEETAEELEHSEVIFPPPSPLSHLKQKTSSGLHRPENIPKYQRNWTVLPSQSPVRTPEPHELRENVPLAFVDTPKTPTSTNGQSNENTVHKPVAQMSTRSSTAQQQSSAHASAYSSNITSTHSEQRQQQQQQQHQTASASTHTSNARQQNKPTAVPIIIEDRSGPVTMAFQSLDEHVVRDHSQPPSRPYTPSRPAPIVPAYQTPEKLCFDECPATHARAYDARSASPFPDRARSPAPGPPPNPLAAIRAPRLKENEVSSLSPRVLQAGSITTGQSYLGAQQAQKQERMLSHTETSSQSGMQSYSHQPEKREEYQVGNLSVQRREQSSRMAEQQQSQMQSQTTTQVGNTQIERRRKVTEEYEHTSSAKTVEIRTGSQTASTERRQSYGKGFVANQARRLSGLEQEITNLTPQSQAISARAATLTETKFPELDSPEPAMVAKFPTKPILPPHDEPQAPSYVVSGAACRSLANTSSSYQQEQKLSSVCGSSMVSTQQQQQQHHQLQQQQQQQKSLTTYSSVSSSQQQQQVNTVSSSLTKASATTLTNNQAYKSITAGTNQNATSTTATTAASASAPLGVCPVTGTFCRPGHTCCKQQTMQLNNNVSNGAAYRPNASLGSGNASNNAASSQQQQQQQSQRQQPQQQMQSAPKQAPAPAPAPTAAASASTNLSTPSSNVGGSNDSAGGLAPKGGAYGATSAPKRGRGIMNKPVAAGVRVPLCHSCSTQIRGPFITALGKIWCPEHFHCVNANCRRPLQDIGFVEEKGDLYCEYCFEKYLAPSCSKCGGKIKGDCLNAIGKHFHPECFSCGHCGKLFGNTPFFLEDGMPYCEADWNELFTTKCFACGFPVEAGDRWVEALNHNYHSQCFNCTYCKQNLEGQSFYNKGGRPFCKNHAR